jgi:hypothetical protein
VPSPAQSQTPEPAATATATPQPSPTPPAPREPPTGSRPFPESQREQALRLLERVAEVRGTPPLGEVSMFLVTRQGALEFYGAGGVQPQAPRARNPRQDLYTLLGLMPEAADVVQQDVGYLGSLITGFYEPSLDAFYLLDDQGGPGAAQVQATVVHELTHALQDQYYDLIRLEREVQADWQRSRVLASILEGDALVVEAAFFGRPLRQMPPCFTLPPDRGGTPYAVQRDLDSWYFDGYCFVQAVLARQPGGIQAIFEDLPSTTEQLLHPEKYLAREAARPVTLTALEPVLGPEWQQVTRNGLGEYFLQNLLRLGLASSPARVQAAAAGWGGDAWALYAGPDGATLLHSTIAWDTAADATEFFEALASSLRGRGAALQPADAGQIAAEVGGKTWRAALVGDVVSLTVSRDAAAVDRVSR